MFLHKEDRELAQNNPNVVFKGGTSLSKAFHVIDRFSEEKEITSIIYDYLAESEPEIMEEFGLMPFKMKTQSLVRTFIDKLFAVCDYYMTEKPTRNSRHLYDIFKLKEFVVIDAEFLKLVEDVRMHRAKMDSKITPSARENVDVLDIVKELKETDFYADDYANSTSKLISDDISYEKVKSNYMEIMHSVFDKN